MQRLKQKTPNTPEYTDQQFKEVWTGELGGVDEERFRLLMSRYKGGKILDVGCFDSPIPIWYDAIGIDHAPETIKVLQDKYPDSKFMCADALNTPFEDNEFDYIVAGEIIEHIEDLPVFKKEMKRILKKGGTLAISTPLDENLKAPISSQHVWSFSLGDIKDIFGGEVEEEVFEDTFETIIAFVTW